MYDFNVEISRFLKEEIGFTGLINAGNWKTADQTKLLDAERYAYSATDVIGVNRYYGAREHVNPTENRKAGYLITKGDLIGGQSVLKQPNEFPLALRQVQGHPMIISESAWVPPLRYQSEGPPLVAAYSALTGIDIFYWFKTNDIGFGPPMGKWQLSTPTQIGMFPAAALMFREGYVQKGQPVIIENRNLADVWSRLSPLLPEAAGFDPNRDTRAQAAANNAVQPAGVTPLTYLAGSVQVAFQAGPNKIADLSSLIDKQGNTARSITGELIWDQQQGISVVDTPKAQGITGDLRAARTISMRTLNVDSQNKYGSLLVVSMDGEDLTRSKKILVQVGTTARPHGWKTSSTAGSKRRITALGSSPWNIENTNMKITLDNPSLTQATQLDANGLGISNVPITKTAHGIQLNAPQDSMYLILQ